MVNRNAEKHPVTPKQITEAMDEWFENGRGGLVKLANQACPEVAGAANMWFERGRARFNEFITAIENLEK